ncbi:Protein translocase subunit SecA [Phycisphaerales bacterium]|nr:Protein translocase subunit SecA [Phycisphaerales bacterium]
MAEQGIPLIGPLLNRLIGTRNERFVKKYTQKVAEINAQEAAARRFTDAELKTKIADFRARHDKGEKSDSIMAEAFAVAREAMDRAVGIRNIFNPKFNFDPAMLPEGLRPVYAELKARMDATPPAEPTGEWQGCPQPVPGWMQVDIPNEIYEAVKELFPESRPPFRARPFDVQLIGGMVLCQGKIAEMKTGEGKTIVAPLACYMAAIERLKIHVVTVNDYLVQRDRDWTFPFFHALGMTVGAIHPQHMQDEGEKRGMYRCDVVYGTTAEFGFDYLRDNMKRSADQQVQKKREFAVVDEVDSILIDEARTPLIISGQAHDDQPRYDLADKLARHLVEKQRPWTDADEKVQKCMMRIKGLEGDIRQARDKSAVPGLQEQLSKAKADLPTLERERSQFPQFYEVKMDRKQAHLTHDGVSEAQRHAGIGSFYVDENLDLPHLLEQSIRAHTVYERDRDYVIMPAQDPQTGRSVPSVVIVDVNTGRPMIGRQWSDGLHQAVECKEKVPIKQETQTVATITIQNFFKMYKRLAGMTGTADTEAQEFHDIYKLDVVAIPTNKQVVRRDFDDLVYLSGKDKWSAIVEEIKYFHDAGRPILVGTTSVEKSESLSKMLTQKHAIHHEVLNAKQHEREANIVENAGQLGAVMIATNMAGRGTDIKLGQVSREKLLDHYLRRGICPRTVTVESTDEQLREGVYRKIAGKELDLQKRDAESMPFPELELALLRHWAAKYTWLTQKQIDNADRDELLETLDQHGRFLLHRIRWFKDIEDMGGLHVIGTERHEARRIDNQLRGRSGRQGDKGSSRFFVSLEDDLMKMFAGETTMKILARLGMKEGDAIEHPMLSKSVANAQKKVEERNFYYRKHILEMDEVKEHQRQAFYGTRQRIIEGRDVKGLIFDYIKSTVDDAVDEYLDNDYPYVSAAEFAKAKLECSIAPERLRGKELLQLEIAIVEEALYEARQSISITLGEYLPEEGSEAQVDFDAQGLARWARNRFGVEINPEELRAGSTEDRKAVEDKLSVAAEASIHAADLSGLAAFVVPHYGANQLAKWIKDKLDFDVTSEEIVQTHKTAQDTRISVTDMLMKRVEELYRKREVEYPVDYAMQLTTIYIRQDPTAALANLVAWSNRRFGANFTPDDVRKTPPAKFRQQLLDLSSKFVEEGRLDKAIAEALACDTDEKLEKHLQERYQSALPESMRYLEGSERTNAIRARIENILRAELLQFERTILLQTLDDLWKDHLYAMDQLQDTINFRGFSQQDPRIEFKKEGSYLFHGMMENIRARITEYVFKARLEPQAPPPPAQPRPAPMPPRAPMPAMSGMMGGSGIVGPGLPTPGGGGGATV